MNRPKQLLVVDDDVDFADSIADLLRAEGHQVAVAYSGESAIGLTRDHPFDLTFMDMQMPGLDGIHSLKAILDLRPDARVVMMTGFSMPERVGQAISYGASSVMNKPLDLARLQQLVKDVEVPLVVLVAEDDVDFAASLRGILEHAGYTVLSVGTGHEAVECVAGQPPDLMLLDLRMPGMDGVEVLKELAQRGLSLPTIVLSAYLCDYLDASFGALPREQILGKPVDTGHLLQLVERVAGGP